MSEFTKFERTKSTIRQRPANGTAGLERSRVSGWRRSPLPPAMIIARTRARRFTSVLQGGCGRRSSGLGRRLGPCRVQIGEDEVFALQAPQRVGGVDGQRLAA